MPVDHACSARAQSTHHFAAPLAISVADAHSLMMVERPALYVDALSVCAAVYRMAMDEGRRLSDTRSDFSHEASCSRSRDVLACDCECHRSKQGYVAYAHGPSYSLTGRQRPGEIPKSATVLGGMLTGLHSAQGVPRSQLFPIDVRRRATTCVRRPPYARDRRT